MLKPTLNVGREAVGGLEGLPGRACTRGRIVLRLCKLGRTLGPTSRTNISLDGTPKACISLLPSGPRGITGRLGDGVKGGIYIVVVSASTACVGGKGCFAKLPVTVRNVSTSGKFFKCIGKRLSRGVKSAPLKYDRGVSIRATLGVTGITRSCRGSLSARVGAVRDIGSILNARFSRMAVRSLSSVARAPTMVVEGGWAAAMGVGLTWVSGLDCGVSFRRGFVLDG